jgi:hypothetical protein
MISISLEVSYAVTLPAVQYSYAIMLAFKTKKKLPKTWRIPSPVSCHCSDESQVVIRRF